MVDLMPSALTPNAPQLNLIPADTGVLTDLAGDDRLLTMSGNAFTGSAPRRCWPRWCQTSSTPKT